MVLELVLMFCPGVRQKVEHDAPGVIVNPSEKISQPNRNLILNNNNNNQRQPPGPLVEIRPKTNLVVGITT